MDCPPPPPRPTPCRPGGPSCFCPDPRHVTKTQRRRGLRQLCTMRRRAQDIGPSHPLCPPECRCPWAARPRDYRWSASARGRRRSSQAARAPRAARPPPSLARPTTPPPPVVRPQSSPWPAGVPLAPSPSGLPTSLGPDTGRGPSPWGRSMPFFGQPTIQVGGLAGGPLRTLQVRAGPVLPACPGPYSTPPSRRGRARSRQNGGGGSNRSSPRNRTARRAARADQHRRGPHLPPPSRLGGTWTASGGRRCGGDRLIPGGCPCGQWRPRSGGARGGRWP